MSKKDIVDTEIERRKMDIENFKKAEVDLQKAIEQFNKLDHFYKDQLKDSRETLECIYKESRHYTGEWPIVYTAGEVEQQPFFKEVDADCNPYFPIEKVKDKTFDGIAPLEAPPTRTGAWQRQRTFTATEDVPRVPALAELQAFPNYQLPDSNQTGEWFPANWPAEQDTIPGYCDGASGSQLTCADNGGTWVPATDVPDPVWVPEETAPALLRNALNAWKTDLQQIIADLCDDDGTEAALYNTIIADIDIVLPHVQVDAVFVRATNNPDPYAWGRTEPFPPGSPQELARLRLIDYAQTDVPNQINARKDKLNGDAEVEEKIFFGLVELRLHQANGSYAKLKAAEAQQGISAGLIADNEKSIATLNLMKAKNS